MSFTIEVARISCECGSEEVVVGFDPEWPCIDLDFWSIGALRPSRSRQPLKHVLRGVWLLVTRGSVQTDGVLLNSKEAIKLRDVLIDLVPKLEEAERKQAKFCVKERE